MPKAKLYGRLAAVITAFILVAQGGLPQTRSMSVDDMLQVEGTGAALASPEASWLFFERMRPYDQNTDYSFRTYAYGKSGHQIWRYDLAGAAAPKLAPGIDPEKHSYLEAFSPSGEFLAIMQYSFGDLSLGAYDPSTEQLVTFDGVPAFSRTGEHNPVWISDHEIVYSALPAGKTPDATSVRAHVGKKLLSAWPAAWRGDTVTAVEVRTPPSEQQVSRAPGQLLKGDARTGKTKALAEGLFEDLRVAPDGKHLAALALWEATALDAQDTVQQTRQRRQLVLIDLETGAQRILSLDLEVAPYSIAWSPEGQRLTFFAWMPGEDAKTGRFYLANVNNLSLTRLDHVGLDLVSERERGWLQRPERAMFLGNALVVFARAIPADQDPAPRFSYQDVRPKGLPRADWYALTTDGDIHNLTSGLEDVSPVPIHAGENHITVAARDGAYRLYAAGTPRRLTPELEGRFDYLPRGTFSTRAGVIRPEFPREALFRVTAPEGERAVMIDLRAKNSRPPVTINIPGGGVTPLAGVAAMQALFISDDTDAAPELRLISAVEDVPSLLVRLNPHLTGIDLGRWTSVEYTVPAHRDDNANGGQTLQSCVLLPPGFDPENPPPLLVDVYPGVDGSCRRRSNKISYPNPQSAFLWAGRGFAYVRVSAPSDLIRRPGGPIAGIPEVVDAGVSAVLNQGLADPDRLVLHGFSQGAITALFIAAKTDRYDAVIAKNGWTDLFSHYFGPNGIYAVEGGSIGQYLRYESKVGGDFGIGRTPFEDPAIYYENSPVFLARDISAPVLLFHSDMDSFSMDQFGEMFGALQRAGKDARYVRYLGEGHGPSSPANIRDMWERTDAFLREAGVTDEAPLR